MLYDPRVHSRNIPQCRTIHLCTTRDKQAKRTLHSSVSSSSGGCLSVNLTAVSFVGPSVGSPVGLSYSFSSSSSSSVCLSLSALFHGLHSGESSSLVYLSLSVLFCRLGTDESTSSMYSPHSLFSSSSSCSITSSSS